MAKQRRAFETFKRGRCALTEKCVGIKPEVVVMESTGINWKSAHAWLERAGFDCMVVNAYHVKNVMGRKTDIADAEWLAMVARAGLLKPSFVPPEKLRRPRLVSRLRQKLVGTLGAGPGAAPVLRRSEIDDVRACHRRRVCCGSRRKSANLARRSTVGPVPAQTSTGPETASGPLVCGVMRSVPPLTANGSLDGDWATALSAILQEQATTVVLLFVLARLTREGNDRSIKLSDHRRWSAKHPDRLQLYSLPTPNGVKVSIALEEMGGAL